MYRTNSSNKSFIVKVGDTVTYEFDNEIKTHTILKEILKQETIDADSPYGSPVYKIVDVTGADLSGGTIHEKSPISKSMLGKKINESFDVTIDGKTHSGKIIDIKLNEIKRPISRIAYTCYASGLYSGNIRFYTITIHREEGITISMKGRGTVDITNYVPFGYSKLQSIFEQIDKMQFPTQRTYTSAATDGDSWRMEIDDVEYTGYLRRPDFVMDILTMIDFTSIIRKYRAAFDQYVLCCNTDTPQ